MKQRIYITIFSLVLIFAVLFSTTVFSSNDAVATAPNQRIKIAVDAGHGGYDPGTSSADGVSEKDVNLAIALKLREVLLLNGYDVVLTRDEDEDFLMTSGPKKQKDMNARKKIIEESGAHYLISIHTNSIPSPKWRGAQTFYQSDREQSSSLAMKIQEQLKIATDTNREAKPTDFYLTREIEVIGVVIEAGFLSNPEECANLLNEEYQYRLAWSITKGLTEFLEKDRNRPPM